MTLGWMKAVSVDLWRLAPRRVPVLMVESASFAFERQPCPPFVKSSFPASFSVLPSCDSSDVVLLQQLHRLSACFAVAVLKVF